MITDPIGDMLSRIKNGYMAKKSSVEVPYSKFKESLAKLLQKYHFVGEIKTIEEQRKFLINLIYDGGKPAVTDINRISKPGLRRYINVVKLKNTRYGLGHLILSTPKGLMTQKEAQKQNLGGEIICKIY